MRIGKLDWSSRGWPRVVAWTIFGTLGCMAVVVLVDSFNFSTLDQAGLTRALLIDVLVPLFLAVPLIFFFTSKLRELAIAHHEMSIIATTDSLTKILNRGAFTMLVDAYLEDARAQAQELRGALLVVDVDNFKLVNDRFGHPKGDDALRLVTQAIRGVLRGADIVGRLGGEEFGVFLPGATPAQAATAAERIRASVDVMEFRPDGDRRETVTVSIGGATFDHRVKYDDLFRSADRRLYEAKESGRNRVSLTALDGLASAA